MHEHEPSYYEIALTNRQVLIAFVILLVCVVAAFFAGVYVGKGEPARAAAAPAAEEQVAESPLEQEAEEFEFFNRGGQAPAPAERPDLEKLAREPNPDTTLAQDLGLEAGPDEGEEGAPADVGAPAQPDRPPAEPPANLPPAGQQPASPGAAAPGAPEAAMPAGSLIIQVFSSRDQEQARKLLDRLRGAGFTAYLSPAEAGRDTMYRVRIGPFTARDEAEAVAARVRRDFRVDTWITAP
ncbi:MAG TPA: SPOR domain-containing protein [Thermoanaerobaculia bacterium]|nr:SPOR domain-containing protein [Thermoanaerobaculia bacterium]